jgi:HEAT repeat protein
MTHWTDRENRIQSKIARLISLIIVCLLFFACVPLADADTGKSKDELATIFHNALKHKDTSVRVRAVRKLQDVRPTTPEIVSVLIKALQDESKVVRGAAVHALGSVAKTGPAKKDISPYVTQAVPALLKVLEDKTERQHIRAASTRVLARIAPGRPDVMAALVRVIEDEKEDEELRVFAAVAIGSMGGDAKGTVPSLLQVARGTTSEAVQVRVWSAIASIVPDNQEATHALIELANAQGTQAVLRSTAIKTLGEIGAVEAMPTFVHALQDEHPEVQVFAVLALGKMGPAAKPAIPALIRLLRTRPLTNDALIVRGYIIGALIQIDPTSDQVISTLKDIAANSPEPALREYAEKALTIVQRGN